MKKKKKIQNIIHFLYIDDFRYLPWRWDWKIWNSNFKKEYNIIRPILFLWQEKGYITLIEDDEIIFIVHPEKLPSKEKLLEESKF